MSFLLIERYKTAAGTLGRGPGWYTAQKKRTRRAVRRFIGDRMYKAAFRAAQDIGFCTVFHPTDGARGTT